MLTTMQSDRMCELVVFLFKYIGTMHARNTLTPRLFHHLRTDGGTLAHNLWWIWFLRKIDVYYLFVSRSMLTYFWKFCDFSQLLFITSWHQFTRAMQQIISLAFAHRCWRCIIFNYLLVPWKCICSIWMHINREKNTLTVCLARDQTKSKIRVNFANWILTNADTQQHRYSYSELNSASAMRLQAKHTDNDLNVAQSIWISRQLRVRVNERND